MEKKTLRIFIKIKKKAGYFKIQRILINEVMVNFR